MNIFKYPGLNNKNEGKPGILNSLNSFFAPSKIPKITFVFFLNFFAIFTNSSLYYEIFD